jgi:hypothetical protein
VPGRHVKPRHRGPGLVDRSVSLAASGVSSAIGASGRALILFGVAGSATAFGLVAAQAADSASASAAASHHRSDAATSAAHHRKSAAVTAALASRAAHAEVRVSRSSERPPTVKEQRATKAKALPVSHQASRRGVTRTIAPATPREVALWMLADYGWSSDQFSCLDELWNSESGWNPSATNSTSGAYGIPQALPPDKMASAGADWRTNPVTQIEWGLTYIRSSYGTPCSAWAFKVSNSWY